MRARADTGMVGPKADGAPPTRKLAEAVVRRLQAELDEELKKHRDVDVDKVCFVERGHTRRRSVSQHIIHEVVHHSCR